MAALEPASGISIYPFLWASGAPVASRSRRPVPLAELWALERDMAVQLEGLLPGTQM